MTISRGASSFGFVLVAMSVGLAAPARADDAPSTEAAEDSRRADAKAQYDKGVQAYTSGRFKDAVDLFLAADRLSPSAPLSFNIARAYEKLGDDSGALRWYRDYLRRAPAAKNAADVQELIGRYEERLKAKGVQQVTIFSTPPGATIAIDGNPVGVTPSTFDLAPGSHRVGLMLRGYADASRSIALGAEHAADVTIELSAPAPSADPAPAAAAPPKEPTPEPKKADSAAQTGHGFGIWPYVTLGAGAAVLGGALTFELLRASSERAAKDAKTQVEYKDHFDTMESRRTTARVLAGVGGALVVTGGVLLAIDLAGGKPKTVARLGLSPAPGGFTGVLAGAF